MPCNHRLYFQNIFITQKETVSLLAPGPQPLPGPQHD